QAAERMVKVFEHHNMRATTTEIEPARSDDPDEHGRTQKLKLLGIDDSYFLAYSFMVDEMGADARKKRD
ncbi:MAG: hypothetical protein AAFV33_16380, partial [Chloroflexota bacterium]